jgi:cytoskeleton-associated protein 5
MNNAPVKQKKEDPKFDEIKSVLGKEIIDSLFSPKWEVKKHGFELINEFINNKPPKSYNLNDLIEYMKLKLKNYKETNFNINREAITIYINMIKKRIISKDLLVPIILAYHEKLADIKLKDNLIELINNSFDIIEPNNILKQIIGKISKKNNAKLLIEYSTFLGNVVEEYDVKDLPNKDIIDFCKVMANNSNPQVRTAAISLLCILYKYLGKDVKTLTRDIKESTLKLIDAELDKVTVIDPKLAGKKKKVASTADSEGKGSSGGGGDLIPPQDISKKITPKIIKDLNGKWAEKKEACESIEKILTTANMRILPNGLNNIMTTIKKKLSDSNKNFVKMLISVLAKFIEALKQGFKQWAKPIALALIPNLADKNQLMRNECQNCFDKWVEYAGLDSLVVHFPQFLKNDNVEMRIEIMNFFSKHKDKFNKSTGELVYKDMMNPLLICLQDRSSNVRNAAEEIIKSSLTFISINSYYKKSEDFKPAITKTLKQILDKIKRETPISNQQESTNNEQPENNHQVQQQKQQANVESNNNNNNQKSTQNPNGSIPKKVSQKEKSSSKINMPKVAVNKKNSSQLSETSLTTEPGIDDSEKNDSSNLEDQMGSYGTVSNFSKTTKKVEKDSTKTRKSAINVKRAKPKRKLSEDDLVNPLGTEMNKQMPVSSVSHLASNSTILKKNERKSFQKNVSQPIKASAVFVMNVKVIPNKAKRFEKDKKTKFSIETVNRDYFNKLKEQCKGLFIDDFSKKIFNDDFRKQVEAFKEMKNQIDKKINVPIYFDNLDLILKIIGIKILNNLNPTLMKNFFEFLDALYLILNENKYKLNETESTILINILIDKFSLNNNTLKEHLISLLNKYIELLDTNKSMVTVLNVALNKNNKIKTDILDITLDLIKQEKLNIANKTYAKILCKFLPIYDNAIKTKTLQLFQEIYSAIGQELWNMIEISEKDKEFLEENLCANEEEEEEEEEKENNEENGKINNNNNNNNINNRNEKPDNTNNIIKTIESNEKININTSQPQENNNSANNNDNYITNQNGPLTKEDLFEALDNLSSNDQKVKLNTIIVIHEKICGKYDQNREILIPNVDKIISTFKNVSHQLFFVKDLKTIPIKFAKYLAIVLCKLSSNKELISNLSYEVLLGLSRELLGYLLINGLDKIGDNQEGNIIFKSINSTMLRILENCDTTSVICALLELIREFHNKENKHLVNLAMKCLLKTTQHLSEKINNIKIDKILLQIHLLLLSLQKNNSDIAEKTSNNTVIINNLKIIVGEFAKLTNEKILEEYSKSVKNHQLNDKYLLRWIKDALSKK